jgi:hypothetical protein
MTDSIVDGTNINTEVFSYSAPKAHASGGKVVNLYNKYSKESLTISSPLILTWGAQEGMDQQKNPTGKFTMALQFPSADFPNADCTAFLDGMRRLEAQVRADALKYSKEWFGKVITSPDVMEEKFNVMLRHPKFKGTQEADTSKSPTLTVKIPCWSGVWKSEIYDEDGEPLYINGSTNSHLTPLEFLQPKTHVICLLQCGGLWFVNGKVSITWNLTQAIVQKPKAAVKGCLLKPKMADKEKLKSLPPPEEPVEADDGHVSTVVIDSDDEGDEPKYVFAPVVPATLFKAPVPVVESVTAAATVTATATAALPVEVDEEAAIEVKPKKKIIKKKSDA